MNELSDKERGWYQSFEMTKKTALLFKEEKQKKVSMSHRTTA
jgi:hypothetical protein